MDTDEFVFDMDASAGDLKWEDDAKTIEASDPQPEIESGTAFWKYPVSGSINLTADSFSIKEYTWKPFVSVLCKEGDTLKLDLVEASLCGIDTSGGFQQRVKRLIWICPSLPKHLIFMIHIPVLVKTGLR